MKKDNLFKKYYSSYEDEIIESIIENENIKLERIVSTGQSSPPGFWYDQDSDEWVILLKGSAELLFENDEPIEMLPGDYIFIPRHCRHRVEKTDISCETIWLALKVY